MRHFFDSIGRSESGPRLPLENGATFAPKVTCFTVYLFPGSHRSRAAAPYKRESSIVLADPGWPGREALGAPIRTVKHVTLAALDPRSSIVLRFLIEKVSFP